MRNNILAVWIHIFIWIISFFPVSVLAFPYHPEQSMDIITEPTEKDGFIPIVWRVAPEVQTDGSTGILFSRQQSGQSVCRLIFSGASTDIFWERKDISPNTIHSGDLLIVSGVPIPCDVLPVEKLFSVDEPIEYEVRMNAGGRTFVERIQVDSAAVSIEDAQNNGWIKYTGDVKTGLRLIKAVNLRTNELMVQQLWADDNPWWIYEETPFRRSWRVR
jgi:hypothetical protein